jgi:hypothetical protein
MVSTCTCSLKITKYFDKWGIFANFVWIIKSNKFKFDNVHFGEGGGGV